MHSPTLLFAVFVNATLMTGVLFLNWKLNPGVGGLREWFYSYLGALANIILFFANPLIPASIGPLVLQALLLCTGALALIGTYHYLERRDTPYRVILVSAAVTLAGASVISLLERDPAQIFNLGSITNGLYFLAGGLVAWTTGRKPLPARRLLALLMLVHGVFMCGRLFVLTPGTFNSLLGQMGWTATQVILIEQMIITVAFGLTIVLLTNENNATELKTLADLDSLTNFYNRRAFHKRLEQACSFARRHKLPLTILMIDVDHFKSINDRHGHDVGDMVLKSVSSTILNCLRAEDVVGRMGGEEFTVCLSNTGPEAGLIVAERIRAAIGASTIPIGTEQIQCSVSIGVTALADLEPMQDTLRRGDRAMYFAKTNGRNRVEYALA